MKQIGEPSVADRQVNEAFRGITKIAVILTICMIVAIFAGKNGLMGQGRGAEKYRWIGDWTEQGQPCDKYQYRIRSDNVAAPKRTFARLKKKPFQDRETATFYMNDGERIDLKMIEWTQLRWRSSNGADLILDRCLNPFR